MRHPDQQRIAWGLFQVVVAADVEVLDVVAFEERSDALGTVEDDLEALC